MKRMSFLLVKQRISVSEPPFLDGLRGNVCDSSLASWTAHSQLSIGYNETFLLDLTTELLIRRNPPLLEGVGAKYTVGWGNSSTTTLPLEVFTQRNFVADLLD